MRQFHLHLKLIGVVVGCVPIFAALELLCRTQTAWAQDEFDQPALIATEPPTPELPSSTATPAQPTPPPQRIRVTAPAVSPSDYTSACTAIVDDIAQLDAIHRAFDRTLLVYEKNSLMTASDDNGQMWSGDESFLPDITNPQLLVGGIHEKGFAISATYQGEPFVEQPFVLVRPFIGNSSSQPAEVVKKVFNVFTGKECLVHYKNARSQLLSVNAAIAKKKKKKR